MDGQLIVVLLLVITAGAFLVRQTWRGWAGGMMGTPFDVARFATA